MKRFAWPEALLAPVTLCAASLHTAPVTAGPEDTLAEIIVTARQRQEKITDVPATVDAFTAADIKSAGIERPGDFVALTPGLSQVQTAEVGDLQLNIRGINTGRDVETNFALVIDGVLQTNPSAFNQELANIQQIEVLKGPRERSSGAMRSPVQSSSLPASPPIISRPTPPLDQWAEHPGRGVSCTVPRGCDRALSLRPTLDRARRAH